MEFDFKAWRERYEHKEIVNIKEEFTEKELTLLKNLALN
jgi:hypothetical protein